VTIRSESERQAYARGYWIKQKANLPEEYRKRMVFKVFKVDIEG